MSVRVTSSEPRVEVALGPQVLVVKTCSYTYDLRCEQCGVEYCNHEAGDGLETCPGDFGIVEVDQRQPHYSQVSVFIDGIYWEIEYANHTESLYGLRKPDNLGAVIERGPVVWHRFVGQRTCPKCWQHHHDDPDACRPA